ncbi:sensor histidine kinase [Cryptosporangium aurantiacum]|uniref:histidine kinase n=1 Tax=Cryptosporangium aurantiacum TaxID=134849 RepID=A0A1M7R2P6_9ACTN|nr:sensor histidine kinase [Cryptosporangium aurantiacum]SHN39012.1 Signal transduction histidine kinase [Cryptosporangium aurantiacum]
MLWCRSVRAIRYPGTWSTLAPIAETERVVLTPERVRTVAYLAAGLIVVAVISTVDGGVSVPTVWLWLVLPASVAAVAVLPGYQALIFAACAAFVALVSTGESVQLGTAVAAFVFLSTGRDPARRPWLGWVGGFAGAAGALAIAMVHQRGLYEQPFVFVVVGYLAATLLRSWSRGYAVSREAAELRGQAAWLEQRTNLARELHDVVGHHVTAMVVQAEAGQLSSDPAVALQRIADSGRTALRDLDTLVVHLRDPSAAIAVSQPPRLSDIDELLAQPLRHQGVTVHVHLDAEPGLDEVGALAAYRITQEALTNVARHAGATAAWVELVRVGANARLRISDDGVGPPEAPARGSGLLGISERVGALGGSWQQTERPGGGTLLEVSLPVAKS